MLSVRGLEVRYGGITAVEGVDFECVAGEFVALVGANGAGKSSLLRAISGLVPQARGEIEFDGASIARWPAERIARAGLVHVPEGRHVFPRLSVRDNLLVGAWGRKRGVAEALERVETLFPRLAERRDQLAYTLSGGEQQMLALGRALMREPKLLILDEPSLGLAPVVVREVFELIQRIHAAGTTVVLVEQNARLALESSDRAYVLADGKVAAEGPSGELARSEEIRHAYLGGVL